MYDVNLDSDRHSEVEDCAACDVRESKSLFTGIGGWPLAFIAGRFTISVGKLTRRTRREMSHYALPKAVIAYPFASSRERVSLCAQSGGHRPSKILLR